MTQPSLNVSATGSSRSGSPGEAMPYSTADSAMIPSSFGVQRASKNKLLATMAREPAPNSSHRSVTSVNSQLGVMVGEQRWLIDLSESGEVIGVPDVIPVPLSQSWVYGLANLRGKLFTVIDFQAFLGHGSSTITKESRVVVFGDRVGLNASILVSRMLGLRPANLLVCEPNESRRSWQGKICRDDAGLVWQTLQLAELAHDPKFLAVERS